MERFFDDFTFGQVFNSEPIKVDADQIKAFAATYDPQSFYLDEEAARSTFFDRLAASGWQTAALTMRLLATCHDRPGRRQVAVERARRQIETVGDFLDREVPFPEQGLSNIENMVVPPTLSFMSLCAC